MAISETRLHGMLHNADVLSGCGLMTSLGEGNIGTRSNNY